MTGFVIGPGRLIKGEGAWEEYRAALPALFNAAKKRANEIWPGFTFGGALPGANQYGITPIRPRSIYGAGTATYLKRYGSSGSWQNIFSYNVPRDELHAYAGLSFSDPILPFSSIRAQIEDKVFPIMDIEEAHGWGLPFQVLWKQDQGKEWVIPELAPVLIKGFHERNTQAINLRIVPLGFMMYKDKSRVINEAENTD